MSDEAASIRTTDIWEFIAEQEAEIETILGEWKASKHFSHVPDSITLGVSGRRSILRSLTKHIRELEGMGGTVREEEEE